MDNRSKRFRWYHISAPDDWQIFGVATLGTAMSKRDAHKFFLQFVGEVPGSYSILHWLFMAEKGALTSTRIYFLLGGIESGSDIRHQLKNIWRDLSGTCGTLRMVSLDRAAATEPGYRRLLKTIRKNVFFLMMYRKC